MTDPDLIVAEVLEPQPCERCHRLTGPLYLGCIVPYFICPPDQTVECLDRAARLRTEGAGESPEEKQ